MMPLEPLCTCAIFFVALLSFFGAPASADPSNSGRAVVQGRTAEGSLPAKARGSQEVMEEKARLGSIPPNCRNKCNACFPCEAIQVPTLPAHGRVHRVSQSPSFTRAAATTGGSKKYSNYKPMGWKCKCGNHLFNP